MIKYLSLFITLIISFLSVWRYEFYPEDEVLYNESIDIFRFLIPGLAFSVFILALHYKVLKPKRIIAYFFILSSYYCFAVYVSFSSWGIGVPFAGAAGALLVKKLFYNGTGLFNDKGVKYILAGLTSAAFGLALFYGPLDSGGEGPGFGAILVSWQLAVGIICIRDLEIPENKPVL
jgi:hypothetical protein